MKVFEQFRIKRQKICEGLFSAQALCIAGLIIMPALLFNPSIFYRILQFLFFGFLAWLSGKKNNPIFTILVFFGIAGFNLIIPYGEVLYSIGAFKITSGALAAGIQRAITLLGLLMLSRFSIREDLKIPGFFGGLIGESFRIFGIILNRKHRISGKNLIAGIDQLMIELSGGGMEAPVKENASEDAAAGRTKPTGFIILAFAALISWLPLILANI